MPYIKIYVNILEHKHCKSQKPGYIRRLIIKDIYEREQKRRAGEEEGRQT